MWGWAGPTDTRPGSDSPTHCSRAAHEPSVPAWGSHGVPLESRCTGCDHHADQVSGKALRNMHSAAAVEQSGLRGQLGAGHTHRRAGGCRDLGNPGCDHGQASTADEGLAGLEGTQGPAAFTAKSCIPVPGMAAGVKQLCQVFC